jgi:proteasome lid subunit RPN8/RPN11
MATDYTHEAAGHGRLPEASPEALTDAPGPAGGATRGPDGPPRDGEGPDDDDDSRATVFGELQPPNIHREPFPQRLLHWKPSGRPEPQSSPISIIVTQDVLERVNRHVSQDLRLELGGFLLGNRYVCPNSKKTYVQIDDCTEAKFASSTPVSMEMVNNTFLQLCEELSGKHRFKDVIGWYHSHPNHDVFLSPDDIRVHDSRFQQDWMVALVVNPNRKIGAFFRRHDGVLSKDATTDFYELLGIGVPPTKTCVPWHNYRCYDAQTDQTISPLPARQEKPRVATRETLAPTPPQLPSQPRRASLSQVKPAALTLVALTFGIILLGALSLRGTEDQVRPEPTSSPDNTPAAAQAQTDPTQESNSNRASGTQESDSNRESDSSKAQARDSSNKGGGRADERTGARGTPSRSAAAAAASPNRRASGRQSRQARTAARATVKTKPQRRAPDLSPARKHGAYGGPG